VIAGLRDLGKTIFLTTHYMEEAERLADRIAVIAAGEIVAEGTPQTLGARHLANAHISFALPAGTRPGDLPDVLAGRAEPGSGERIALASSNVAADLQALSAWALARGLDLADLEVGRPTLEEVYLKLTTQDQTRR
jgi:ABC-2 type transport system ATP-binding protein